MMSAAILAGGAGRRLGTPKVYLKKGSSYLYELIVEELSGCAGEVMIVLSGNMALPRNMEGLIVVRDEERFMGMGPLAGIYTALSTCCHLSLFVCGTDMPFITKRLALFLHTLRKEKGSEAAIPFVDGRLHPLCASYGKETKGKVERMLMEGELRTSYIRECLETEIVDEDCLAGAGISKRSLGNINTPSELQRFKGISF